MCATTKPDRETALLSGFEIYRAQLTQWGGRLSEAASSNVIILLWR